jgi:hypothetical protein
MQHHVVQKKPTSLTGWPRTPLLFQLFFVKKYVVQILSTEATYWACRLDLTTGISRSEEKRTQ